MPDTAARARALDPRTSFIVRAPAGSGKTELLIQRYLRLLATVEAPESILAITFTRKAAAEMRARVLEALQAALRPRPVDSHKALTWDLARTALDRDRAAGWRLLENPARIGMQTIDSLCVAIARQMPWLARFGAIPEITEKAGPLYQEAARLTLLGPDRQDAIATLLLHLDNNFSRVQDLIAQMLERRDQWLRHLHLPAGIRDQVELCLAELIQDVVRELRDAAIDAGLPDAAGLPAWKGLADDLLTQKDEWRKRHTVAQRLAGNDLLLECFRRLRNLPPPEFTETQWDAIEAIVAILPIAVANLTAVFREHATVDFIELNLASLRALSDPEGPTDLGLAFGYRIEHILLDEFQDTSYTQYDLLTRLTQTWDRDDGRTLFLVGDPMQSIYRFRQAEVGLFLKAWQNGIRNIALETLTLAVNFRSGAEIVKWVNDSFRDVFPKNEDAVFGAVAYSGSTASGASRAAVDAHAFLDREEEADRVANLTKEALGTVGILVRARSHLPAIIAALKQRGIRYQAIEIDELGQRSVIQDLMALTFTLLHPADKISRLASLRAPWSGLTLAELVEQVSQPVLPAPVEQVSRPVFAARCAAVSDRGRRTLRDLVEQTWICLGGPACITSDSDLDDAAAYFGLLDTLDDGGDLADFDILRRQVRELFAQPDATADGRVQIMTIHKAKGLEFDTVILPGLDMSARRDEGQLILWHEPSPSELLFAPIPEAGSDEKYGIYHYLSKVEQQKADYEAVRLLYVAATRARTNLHLLGCGYVKADGTIGAHSGSFLRILWPAVESHFATLKPAAAVAAPQATAWQPRPIRRLVAGWQLPDPPAPVHWNRTGAPVSDLAEVTYEWVGDTLRHVGTAVHMFLARIAREGLERWDAATLRSREPAWRIVLLNMDVTEAEIESASKLVQNALLRAITDERGRWVLQNRESAESELAIAGVSDGQVYEAVIDRTFIDDEGSRWVIDYKTGSHTGGSVEKFLATEKERYGEQLERYARLLAQQEDRPIRLGLYFPLVEPGWVEWEARSAAPRQASLFAESGAVLR
jgi:ATP-dependent helicase/nuclease subunit A